LSSPDVAYRGAEAFAALGCASCHQPSGSLSINPANQGVERAVRGGERGMPCFSAAVVPDGELLDIRTYIATFPASGVLGAPRAGGGPSGPPPGQGGPPPAGESSAGAYKPCPTSTPATGTQFTVGRPQPSVAPTPGP